MYVHSLVLPHTVFKKGFVLNIVILLVNVLTADCNAILYVEIVVETITSEHNYSCTSDYPHTFMSEVELVLHAPTKKYPAG